MTRSAIRSQMDLNSEIRLGFQMGFQMPIRLETLKLRGSSLAIRWDSLKPMDLNSDFRSEILKPILPVIGLVIQKPILTAILTAILKPMDSG